MSTRHAEVAARAGHRCEYCHAPEAVFNFPFEVEHILPVSRGGPDSAINLALACRSCNLRKSAHLDGLDSETRQVVRLFHPRDDRWEEHFRVQPETGEIGGLTPIGRATVTRLEINSEAQLAARLQWIRLGLFP
jgi:hypothetical protein